MPFINVGKENSHSRQHLMRNWRERVGTLRSLSRLSEPKLRICFIHRNHDCSPTILSKKAGTL